MHPTRPAYVPLLHPPSLLSTTRKERGNDSLPPPDESVAAHLCKPMAIGWKAKAARPSKPCRKTSALAGRVYASAGQAASPLHSMAVLQVFQAKLLRSMDESNPNPTAFNELRSASDLDDSSGDQAGPWPV